MGISMKIRPLLHKLRYASSIVPIRIPIFSWLWQGVLNWEEKVHNQGGFTQVLGWHWGTGHSSWIRLWMWRWSLWAWQEVVRRIFSETKLNSRAQFYQMVTGLFFCYQNWWAVFDWFFCAMIECGIVATQNVWSVGYFWWFSLEKIIIKIGLGM